MQGVLCNQCSRIDNFSAWEKAARDNPDFFTKPSDYICPKYGILYYILDKILSCFYMQVSWTIIADEVYH